MHIHVRVKGAVGPTVSSMFDDVEVRTETVLAGELADEAALGGLLGRLIDLGLQVVDVQVSTPQSSRPAG